MMALDFNLVCKILKSTVITEIRKRKQQKRLFKLLKPYETYKNNWYANLPMEEYWRIYVVYDMFYNKMHIPNKIKFKGDINSLYSKKGFCLLIHSLDQSIFTELPDKYEYNYRPDISNFGNLGYKGVDFAIKFIRNNFYIKSNSKIVSIF